jgi:hypothetical protein
VGILDLLDEHLLFHEPPLDPVLHIHLTPLPTFSRSPSYSLCSLPDGFQALAFSQIPGAR